MKEFSQLFHDLDESTKTNARLDLLVKYFNEANPADSIWVCWFLAGNRIKGAIKTKELRIFASERTGLPEWLLKECHDRVGDLAETISLLINAGSKGQARNLDSVVKELIKPMVFMSSDERKEKIFEAWDSLGEQDLIPFHKLLTGGFRMGVSKGNLYKALARVGNVKPAIIAQRLAGMWTPETISLNEILNPVKEESRMCQPFPFCLAHPLQDGVENLGKVGDWQVEWKWDGIRAQLINRGVVLCFGRGEMNRWVTHSRK